MPKNRNLAGRTTSRLFVGVKPNHTSQAFFDGLTDRCQELLDSKKAEQVRWTTPTNRHLTLVFLGDTPIEKIPLIERRLARAAKTANGFKEPVFSLNPFPHRHSKLLAAELTTSAKLLALHQYCKQLASDLGMEPEKLGYRPHITLARCKNGFREFASQTLVHTLWLDNIILYQSSPAPGSSHYQPLFEATLSGEC